MEPDNGADSKSELADDLSNQGSTHAETLKQSASPAQKDGLNNGRRRFSLGKYGYAMLVLFVAILLLDIYFRTGMLKYAGFFEPDGFYHFSVIRAAVAHGFAIPKTLVLSGFPAHFPITEPLGLYFVTLFPYAILQYFGVSYYTVMRLVPILFGVLDAIGAFYIMRYFAKSRVLAFLAMFFVAISSGDVARTAALVYRGDGFITSFMILALIFFVAVFRQETWKRKLILALASAFVLGVGTAVWNGAPFTIIVYMLAVLLVAIFAYITADKKLIEGSIMLMLALLLTYAMQHMWMALTIIRAQQALSTLHFFIFYAPILLGALLAWALLEKRDKLPSITMNTMARARFILVVIVIALAVVLVLFGSFLSHIASGDGLVIASSHLNVTIQELQPPTWAFIWASFGYQILLAPIGIVLYLIFARRIYPGTSYSVLGKLNFTPQFLAMLGYFIATIYLQINAVRFNSIVAVPIAIFAAYAVYGAGKLLGVDSGITKLKKNLKSVAVIIFIAVIAFIFVYSIYTTNIQSFTAVQADGINPQFLSALGWAKNNTASNATFLAVWPDGSVIEGWANRTSAMDSVGGQNSQLIAGFSRFILNTSPDTQYLISKVHKPEYLLARYYWLQELGGISIEGGLNGTYADSYGYDAFNTIGVTTNSTSEILSFQMPASPYLKAALVINEDNSSDVVAGISNGDGSSYTMLKHVILYNMANDTAKEVNDSKASINYTYFVTYSGRNITSAAMVGPNFTRSNMYDFLFGCGYSSCSYGNGTGVSMKLIYQNGDSRIFSISYANSSS